MPDATWIEPNVGKMSEFREVCEMDPQNRMDAYHRKVELANRAYKKLSNPRSSRFALNPRHLWYAYQVKRAILASAACDVASAKAMRRADEICTAGFMGKSAAAAGGSGMDLDH